MASILPTRLPATNAVQILEARQFSGGLNTYDSPFNLNTRFIIEADNIYPDSNGRLRIRYGTSQFADLQDFADNVIAMEYYGNMLVAVSADGRITTVNSQGVPIARWTRAIAASKSTTFWSTNLSVVNFTQFNARLIICNGIDKPLIMAPNYDVNYLADVGTGTNVNVPRAKYCTTHNNYLILASTPTDKTTLYIGMKGTAGTFVGDAGIDNDAVNFVTSTYINRGSPDITGLTNFRDKLIVSFTETLLAIQLGRYSQSSPPRHTPDVVDAIENHGSVSQRCIVSLGDDVLFLDGSGMSSVERALITATLSPVRESTLISTELQRALSIFTPVELERHVFAVHDRIAQHIMFFIPKSKPVTTTTENYVYTFCFDRSQRFRAWTLFSQMAYRCGTRTNEGRVFFASGTNVFYYRNQFDPGYTDYAILGEQSWDDGTLWEDGIGWVEPTAGIGTPIPYAFSLPWSDLRQPGIAKHSRYAHVVAEGAGIVTLQMFIDGFSKAEMSAQFIQTNEPEDTASAGERPLNNMQLYAWPQKFETMRMRVSGQASAYIGFTRIRLGFVRGNVRR